MCLLASSASHAALINRGGGLIYDDVLDVTWLQDTQYAVTSGYSATPQLTFDQALAFAAGLEYYDRARELTWNDWRLPGVTPGALAGYDPSGANSELGFMYYVNLGLGPIYPGAPREKPAGDPFFPNHSDRAYWTGSALKPDTIWAFQFGYGSLGTTSGGDAIRVWLVRDGDVGPQTNLSVPEPGSLALFAAGLVGVALARRRKRGDRCAPI